MIRRRIGLVQDIGASQASKLYKSTLVLCSKNSSIKKLGRAHVRSLEEEIGVFLLPTLSTKIVYGSDHEKIVAWLERSVYGFAIVVTSKELSESHKKKIDSAEMAGKIEFVVINEPALIMDVGASHWLRVQPDLDLPLYDLLSTKKLKAKTSSSSSHKAEAKIDLKKKSKVKAVEPASLSPLKRAKKKDVIPVC